MDRRPYPIRASTRRMVHGFIPTDIPLIPSQVTMYGWKTEGERKHQPKEKIIPNDLEKLKEKLSKIEYLFKILLSTVFDLKRRNQLTVT